VEKPVEYYANVVKITSWINMSKNAWFAAAD
jgi:hypothetical protein